MTARKTPAAAEALGEKIAYHFNGKDYFLDPSSEWSFDALEAFEEGRIFAFLKMVLGAEQYAELKKSKPNAGDLNVFIEGMQKALGIAGN